MAFVSGSAASASDLLLAIQNACTANGWALSASGNVLSKGTCFVELKVSGTSVSIRGGRGVDGSGNLTGATDRGTAYVGLSWYQDPFVWPCTYFIHILTNPDEVYVIVNYSATAYQNLAFGQSTTPGLAGTGNWYSGATGQGGSGYTYGGMHSSGEYSYAGGWGACSLFQRWYDSNAAHGVDHSLDSTTWADNNIFSEIFASLGRQPNQWNSESILTPIRTYAARPSGFYSIVLELAHARAVNIANLNDQQVITIGSDKWKIYPVFRRDSTYWHQSSPAAGHSAGSWLFGHAIRYDGP